MLVLQIGTFLLMTRIHKFHFIGSCGLNCGQKSQGTMFNKALTLLTL